MDCSSNNFRFIVFAILFFVILALVRTSPALLSSNQTVAAFNEPDIQMAMWGIWRTKNAILGKDFGYFGSYMVTYPVVIHEPISIYDSLLPLLSVPLQFIFSSLPLVLNLLTTAGIALTAISGYLLILYLLKSPALALVGGTIMAMNPFVFRQLAGGYIEYSWWGLVPLSLYAYLRYINEMTYMNLARYLLILFSLFNMSIYCSCYFVLMIMLLTLFKLIQSIAGKNMGMFRRIFIINAISSITLSPLLIFWLLNLQTISFRCFDWNHEFPYPVAAIIDNSLMNTTSAQNTDASLIDPASDFLTWRVLFGSLDIFDLVSFNADSSLRELEGFEINESFHHRFEVVLGKEWLIILILSMFAFLNPKQRWDNLKWLLFGISFLLLSMGPYLIWRGEIHTEIKLPYAWLYKWLPGFSRLVVPGRAFLITILSIAVLACKGLFQLLKMVGCTRLTRSFTAGMMIALFVFISFSWIGDTSISLPKTTMSVPEVYKRILNTDKQLALLEMPLDGNRIFRSYCQTVHEKPIFMGAVPDFMVHEYQKAPIFTNPIIEILGYGYNSQQYSKSVIKKALLYLKSVGFHYLILHLDEYGSPADSSLAYKFALIWFGSPFYEDDSISAWEL